MIHVTKHETVVNVPPAWPGFKGRKWVEANYFGLITVADTAAEAVAQMRTLIEDPGLVGVFYFPRIRHG